MAAETTRHPRDMPDAQFARALQRSHRPDLLREIAVTARKSFGFFTAHFPHTCNYTWILERLEFLEPGAHLLDVGAGITPLPLILARRGMFVQTIDGSRMIRRFPVQPNWNEWGFFDYSALHPNLISENCSCAAFSPSRLFDRIYSVSVLAHMPRGERLAALASMRRWLSPGGRLLLAVDLMPSTDFLWNRSEGVQIAPPEQHGNVPELCTDIEALGFGLTERAVIRGLESARTDLLFLECSLSLK